MLAFGICASLTKRSLSAFSNMFDGALNATGKNEMSIRLY